MTLSEALSAYHTRGTIMRRRFTQTEVYYLNTLPAVERASMDRITYSKEFQVRCMAQYLRGNGPTSIFASAGLDPKIVGGKRIERAIARWKADPKIMLEAQTLANKSDSGQRDLLVITQAMTIKWLEKKIMDLQKQLHLLESHAMNCSLPNSNSKEGLVIMACHTPKRMTCVRKTRSLPTGQSHRRALRYGNAPNNNPSFHRRALRHI